MASPASSEASTQAARPSVFWPITATVAVIKALAAIKGEAQPLTPVLGSGGTDPGDASGARPTPSSLARFDAPKAQDADAGLPAASPDSAAGEDAAPVAIEPLPEGESGAAVELTAFAATSGAGGISAPVDAPGNGGTSAAAPSPAPAPSGGGTGGAPAQPAQAVRDEAGPEAVADTGADDGGAEAPAGRNADAPPVPSPFLASAGNDDGFGYSLINGDGYDDLLVGTLRDDRMDGRGGDDRLQGLAGDDTLNGGTEDDTIDGGAGDDRLLGGPDDDTLEGGRGDDRLEGGAGSDYLSGLGGDDALIGGLGRDELAGMAGADRFVFTDVAESPAYAPDWVLDFSAFEQDILDLSAIDANGSTPEDDAFTYIGGDAFSGTSGELRVGQQRSYSVLEVDVDGDGGADMGITLLGVSEFTVDDVMG